MTNTDEQPERQNDPDELWKIIDERDRRIIELQKKVGQEHWYNANSGRGDGYKFHCQCGMSWHDKSKLDSHIAWKLAHLTRTIE